MAKKDLTVARLRELLAYDPETGAFTWIKHIGPGRDRVGAPAGTARHNGYVGITIDGMRFMAHRLAWLYVQGEWPQGQIDHINGCRNDNRACNLRDVAWQTNAQNMRKPAKTNRTGVLGVYSQGRRFCAKICVDGMSRYLGTFDTPEEAGQAYVAAKRQLHIGCTL